MTNDVNEALRSLRSCAGEIAELVGFLEWQFGNGAPEEEEPAETPATAFEDVRGVLADISRQGHTDAIRGILNRFGAEKLSQLDPRHYAAVLSAAKEVSNAG